MKKSVTQPHSKEVGREQQFWEEELDTLLRVLLKVTGSNLALKLVRGMGVSDCKKKKKSTGFTSTVFLNFCCYSIQVA